MGKTAFSGPAFGSYSQLWSFSQEVAIVSTAASTVANIAVPPGQDWYVCYVAASRESTASTALVVSLLDDSTVVATVAITSSVADAHGSTRPTTDQGEYMGTKIASGSTLSWVITGANSSAAALASSGVKGWAYGYIRWIPSTTYTE